VEVKYIEFINDYLIEVLEGDDVMFAFL